MILWRPTRLPRNNTKKDVLFIIADCNTKIGSQEKPAVTGKFGLGVQNQAGQSLTEFCQENTQVTANTLFQQHKRRLYTWTSPDGQYWNWLFQFNCLGYILGSWRWRNSTQSVKTRPGAVYGSDCELLIPKLRFKLKKVGKTTRASNMSANLESSAVATGLEESGFIPVSKKSNAKECSNYHTIALILCASKEMLKILQVRLQQYVNWEPPDIQVGFGKGRGPR